jgi:hypothetical protein
VSWRFGCKERKKKNRTLSFLHLFSFILEEGEKEHLVREMADPACAKCSGRDEAGSQIGGLSFSCRFLFFGFLVDVILLTYDK